MVFVYSTNDTPGVVKPGDMLVIGGVADKPKLYVDAVTLELIEYAEYSTRQHIIFDDDGHRIPTEEEARNFHNWWRQSEAERVRQQRAMYRGDEIVFLSMWHKHIKHQMRNGWTLHLPIFELDGVQCMFHLMHANRLWLYLNNFRARKFVRYVWPKLKAAFKALKAKKAKQFRKKWLTASVAVDRYVGNDWSFFAKLQH
uniref:Uncharacterized protein n=1 Tax=Panagrolaimus sp. JU765 TaxID=591449 RepID=A0AC34RL10_9BILA